MSNDKLALVSLFAHISFESLFPLLSLNYAENGKVCSRGQLNLNCAFVCTLYFKSEELWFVFKRIVQ